MIEVLKQALDALETEVSIDWTNNDEFNASAEKMHDAITSLRQAIKELENQRPVAWQVHPFDYGIGHKGVYARTDRPEQVELWKRKGWNVQPLYIHPHPPQRTWVGLTDEEIKTICLENGWDSSWQSLRFAQAIEAKLKERNT